MNGSSIIKSQVLLSTSNTAAAPIPVPMHIETIPYRPFVLFSSCSNVVICLVPVQPKGCPNAMAPPLGFTRIEE